jgi:hypothetical protein
VVYVARNGAARTLTSSGRDSAAVQSPDGRTVAFVRYVGGTASTPYPDLPRTQLRTVDVRSGRERLLVRSPPADAPQRTLAAFQGPAFSPSGNRIYFVSEAWVTSGAVHAVSVATGREWYVCPGSSVEVVPRGEYRGDLLVEQHRYWLGGGSYDWMWLVTPRGKPIDAIGETDEQLADFLRMNADPRPASRNVKPRRPPTVRAPASPDHR